MPASPLTRVTRSVAIAAVALVATVFAHVIAGGSAPGLFVIVATAVPTLLGTVALSWSQRRAVHVVASVALSQVAFHWLFTASQAAAGATLTGAPGAGETLAGHAHHLGAGSVVFVPAAAAGVPGPAAAATMVVAHCAAGALIAAFMYAADTVGDLLARAARWAKSLLRVAWAPRRFGRAEASIFRYSVRHGRALRAPWRGRAPPARAA